MNATPTAAMRASMNKPSGFGGSNGIAGGNGAARDEQMFKDFSK